MAFELFHEETGQKIRSMRKKSPACNLSIVTNHFWLSESKLCAMCVRKQRDMNV